MTQSDAAEQILAFAQKIFHRADGLDDVVPAGHQPDWKDRPTRFRLYPQTPRIPLLSPARLNRSYTAQVSAVSPNGDRMPSMQSIAVLLYLMAAPLRRKIDITWNTESAPVEFTRQEYGRGSASGGGLYPVQLYLAAAGDQELKAGVFHYSTFQHALVPVRYGDWTENLARAVNPGRNSEVYPYYLILSVDFWANCFKYHNFGYHVCSEDVGVMLATLQLGSDALGIRQQSFLAFDDSAANQVLGADGQTESVFAVVGLGPAAAPSGAFRHPDCEGQNDIPATPRAWQRSRVVSIPEKLLDVHRLTMTGAVEQDSSAGPAERDGEGSDSASHGQSRLDASIRRSLPSVLLARRSAWNSMHGGSPMKAEDLRELLQFVSHRADKSATLRETIPNDSLSLAVRIRAVAGFEPGIYRWSPHTNSFVPMPGGHIDVWQHTYAMTNYNIDEAACILFVVGNLPAVVKRYGARGYRILNAYVGMAAQLTYVAAAALQLDCGAVLGVRAQHVKRTLRLEPDQNVFLAIYLSQTQNPAELFAFHLVPDVPTWKPAQ